MQTGSYVEKHPATVMILAAGVGSRLRPLTDHKPKALLNYDGRPMIDHVICNLKSQGFHRIVVNIHHHAETLKRYLDDYPEKDVEIVISDESERLMDTGGAIIHARDLLDNKQPFIVHNVDIKSDLDLRKLYEYHLQYQPLATLAVKKRDTSRNLGLDARNYLSGWKNNLTSETKNVPGKTTVRYRAFSGIHVIDPEVFKLSPKDASFSIIKAYLELAAKYPVLTFDHSQDQWIDMASVKNRSQLS